MHGLGNDFLVINNLSQSLNLNKPLIKSLSDRHTGIGFDQLLLVEPSTKADFFCRIYNSDGSEAEQCGNGMRCIAQFLHEEKLITQNTMTIETKARVVQAIIHDYETIQINMGVPLFHSLDTPNDLPIMAIVSMGNPHAILHVPSIQDYPIHEWGPKISTHSFFKNGINVGFMEIKNKNAIRLRTYERGAGETLACGSNACAAVAAGIAHQLLHSPVTVELALGHLIIEWKKDNHTSLLMTGPANRIFSGLIENYQVQPI
jgi:diaminopimelate epimerase